MFQRGTEGLGIGKYQFGTGGSLTWCSVLGEGKKCHDRGC